MNETYDLTAHTTLTAVGGFGVQEASAGRVVFVVGPKDADAARPHDLPRVVFVVGPKDADAARPHDLPDGFVTEFLETRSWISQLQAALDGFAALPHDWDSYGASGPSAEVRLTAERVLDAMWRIQVLPSRIAPTSDAGVMISVFGKLGRASIECGSDGAVFVVIRPSNGPRKTAEITEDEILDEDGDLSGLLAEIALCVEGGSSPSDVQVVP